MAKRQSHTLQMLPERRFLGAAVVVLILGILIFGAIGILQLILRLYRPMFSNVYGRGGDRLFSMWTIAPPHIDRRKNAVIADYRLNLLVVFLTDGNIDPVRFWHPHPATDGVVFPAEHGEDDLDFHVPKVENTLIVFSGDGFRQEFPLAPREAERIHKSLDDYPEDLRPVLGRLYGEKHSGKPDLEFRGHMTNYGDREKPGKLED